MNQVAIRKQETSQKLMLLDYMADKYSLTADEFRKTVRATCGLSTATGEQVAAFLIVAKEYDLNPLTKEIYAFPGRGGGVVPIVSIDGWVNLVNSHPQCDGFDFAVENDPQGGLFSMTCTMHRKDRKHPTIVTEYLSECVRSTEPWKMKHRMLRHKSFIQAARYAFGFAGIYDEDEGRTIAEAVDVTPRPRVPSPSEMIEGPQGADKYVPGDIVSVPSNIPADAEVRADPISSGPAPKAKSLVPDIVTDYEGFLSWSTDRLDKIETAGDLEAFWNDEIEIQRKELMPPDMDDLMSVYRRAERRFS